MKIANKKAILDACVLYPAPVRDILLNVAEQELFQPKWSKKIEDEWLRNLLVNRPDLKKERLEKTIKAMNKAFPKALVHSFEELIEGIKIPDLDDRHVVAAAIKSKSEFIITFNLKDFPNNYINQFDIEALNPDTFLCNLFAEDESKIRQAFSNQLDSLRNPPKTKEELIATLTKCKLTKFAKLL